MAVNLLKKKYLALAASLLLAGHVQATELLNSSYDVSRELFAALNTPFEQQWAKDNGGDKLTIKQSHAGSSKQALAILQGLSRPTGKRACRITARRSIPPWASWCVRATRRVSMTGMTSCAPT